ncbi:PREDICTED: transmembrane protein 177 isoform X2 [Dinoponera quadriceps]|uniref:Transmembrane protein 177 isoform X2 n=1 Tax=Dinoponera quadriceps TaxID=609295 RepID=A0A6P3WY32_DINQU|nr:PREDICTED: transmembrane protein 177 isoform X2 [Dinoponera quadriceps]
METPMGIFCRRYCETNERIGKEVPLSPRIEKTIQRVMDDLKLPDNVRNVIKPFSVFGFEVFQAGTLGAKYGAVLGIPINFTRTSEKLRQEIQIKEEPLDWSRQDTRVFLSSLSMSESARKFAIAREILRIQAEEPCFNSLRLAMIVGVLWALYNVITLRFQLRERNVIFCRSLYLSFTLLGAILWIGIKDYRSYRLDIVHDRTLYSLGSEYAMGGQEFYEKLLMRNRALRSLLGNDGEKQYTANGNERIFLRQKHMPITHRKDFFDSHVELD